VKYLLDTHLLVWTAAASHRLPSNIRALIEDPANTLYFSAASIWEVAIKHALGRHDFLDPAVLRNALLDHGYLELPVTSAHPLSLRTLPHLHKDPFDRILIAQAISEGITLLTIDPILTQYPGPIRKP